MELDFDNFLEMLDQSPEDWSLRIRAIEECIRRGDKDRARNLVRTSPDSSPLPPELQVRLHALLTKGIESVEPLEEFQPAEKAPVEEVNTVEPVPKPEKKIEVSEKSEPVSEPKTEQKPPGESFTGGLGALIEEQFPLSPQEKTKPPLPETTVDLSLAGKRWKAYQGNILLTRGEIPRPEDAPVSVPERFSSISLAVLFHLILFLLVSLIAVNVPRKPPIQLILSPPHEKDTTLTITKITKPAIEFKPTAAAAQSIDVITALSNSKFGMPDVENSNNTTFVSMLPGLQSAGVGMSFSTEATEASDINFFGISGGGKKIVFIIDATPLMLIDEKGGMDAYDKVKNEVGIMLANLNRGTYFNILLYQGKRVVAFRDKLVPGLPSNLRMATEWLDPLNRDYAALGLNRNSGVPIDLKPMPDLPLQTVDLAHYTKCIHKAMEWHSSAIFCISSGYQTMTRSPTPEMLKEMAEAPPATPGKAGTFNPGEKAAWDKAVAKTRDWLNKENAARKEKGISQKVVINFNQLVRQITGATPPRRTGGTPATGGSEMPPLPPITYKDIENHIRKLVKAEYKDQAREEPGVHMVLFLGEEEKIGEAKGHFRSLVSRNRGKLKILQGLAALGDVTSEE